MSGFVEFVTKIDISILDFIKNYINMPLLDGIMVFFTKIGDLGIIWVTISALLLISKKTRYIGFVALIALLFSLIFCNLTLKEITQRDRPFIGTGMKLLIPEPLDYSFPSGHTSSSFAAAFVFGKYFKKQYAILTYILASLVAFSRLYLYVHYPSDIIVGIILAYGCYLLAILLFDQYKNYQERRLKIKKN